jgi:hypothetical protein
MDLASDPIIVWTSRLLLVLVLGAAALSKLRALDEFVGVVHNYRVLPEPLVRPVAYALPPFELLLAAGLLLEPIRSLAAAAVAGLLAVFALAMAINIGRGRIEIDCGCFANALRQRIGWRLVVRNVVLIALALLVMPAELSARPLVWLDLVTALMATAGAVLLYAAFSRLAGMAPLARPAAPGHRHA